MERSILAAHLRHALQLLSEAVGLCGSLRCAGPAQLQFSHQCVQGLLPSSFLKVIGSFSASYRSCPLESADLPLCCQPWMRQLALDARRIRWRVWRKGLGAWSGNANVTRPWTPAPTPCRGIPHEHKETWQLVETLRDSTKYIGAMDPSTSERSQRLLTTFDSGEGTGREICFGRTCAQFCIGRTQFPIYEGHH